MNAKKLFPILLIILLTLSTLIIFYNPAPETKALNNPSYVTSHSLFCAEDNLDTSEWVRYASGSYTSVDIRFSPTNGLELGVQSSGSGHAQHIIRLRYPIYLAYYSIENFNFQLSKISGRKPYSVWAYITPWESTYYSPEDFADYIKVGINENGYFQVTSKRNNLYNTYLVYGQQTWSQFVIALAGNGTWWVYAWLEDTHGGISASQGWHLIATGNDYNAGEGRAYAYIVIDNAQTQLYYLGSQYFSETWSHTILNQGVDGRILSTFDLGMAYMMRLYYRIPNTDYAVMKDSSWAIPISIYDSGQDKWYVPGMPKNPDVVIYQKIIQEDENMTKIQFEFYIFNGLQIVGKIKVEGLFGKAQLLGFPQEYAAKMYYKLKLLEYQGTGYTIYFADQVAWTPDTAIIGSEREYLKDFGYPSIRYVARHVTWIFANLLEELGISDKASRLKNFMTSVGYSHDFYDSLFGLTNDLPDDYFTNSSLVFPDPQLWNMLPHGLYYYPYKSRLAFAPANAFYTLLVKNALYSFHYSDALPAALCVRASHLLHKYPNDQNARDTARQLLDAVGWDGNGTRMYFGFSINPSDPNMPVILYTQTAYPGYTVGTYLSSLSLYYSITKDGVYKMKAKQVVDDILTSMQWHPAGGIINGYPIPVKYPGSTGGFLASYLPTNSLGYSTNQGGFLGTISDILVNTGVVGAPAEKAGFSPVNSECTGLALKGLWDYISYCMVPYPNPSTSNTKLSSGIASNWYKWKEVKSATYANILPDGYGRTKFTTSASGKFAWKYFLKPAPYPPAITLTSTFEIEQLDTVFWGVYAGTKTPDGTYARFATVEITNSGSSQIAKITWTKADGTLGTWQSDPFNILGENCTLSFTVYPTNNDYTVVLKIFNQNQDFLVNKTLTITDHKYNWQSKNTLQIGVGVYQKTSSPNTLYIEWQSALLGGTDVEN